MSKMFIAHFIIKNTKRRKLMFKTRVVKEKFTLSYLRLLKISLMRKLLVVQLNGIKRVLEWYT